MDDEKPFKCPKCTQCFATSDHLVVHQRMHANENTQLLVKMPATSSEHASDQTPTPTRFLKTADVEGSVLFEEINPFDRDFKLASRRHASPAPEQGASAISSTMEEGKARKDLCPQKGCVTSSSINTNRHLAGESSRDDETEVSSTVESNLKEIESNSKEKIKGSIFDHNQISSSSSSDEQSELPTSSLNTLQLPKKTSVQISLPSASINSSMNTLAQATASSSTIQQPILSSGTDHNQNNQTSLQTLLQQIQKQTHTPDVALKTPVTSASGTQSQEALREQLKSLIKSGQIKIKFTSDPSSPKVQATIVGNIAKKTSVAPRTTIISSAQPIKVDQQVPQSEVLFKKEQLSQQPLPQKLLIPQRQPSTLEQIVPRQPSPKIQLPQKLIHSPLNAIQIKPKPIMTKHIPIAPKEVTTSSDSSKSVSSPMPLLCSSSNISTNSWSVSPANPASRLAFTKQKLKHVLQQNASSGMENSLANGHVSMVTNTSTQGKYKDIVLDEDLDIDIEEDENNETFKHGRKQKVRVNEDCSPEEKRQRFLERNRAAAARCRQKRKIWVTQLESKSDDLLTTNNLLMNEINALRSEVAQLKALLLAHKDCPVTQQQKALLGQMTPGSYVAAVSDGQIIAIHQVPNGDTQQASSAEEVASSALTDMAARATIELGNSATQSSVTVQSTEGAVCTASNTMLPS